MWARMFCGSPVWRKTFLISTPETKPSRSESVCLNRALYLKSKKRFFDEIKCIASLKHATLILLLSLSFILSYESSACSIVISPEPFPCVDNPRNRLNLRGLGEGRNGGGSCGGLCFYKNIMKHCQASTHLENVYLSSVCCWKRSGHLLWAELWGKSVGDYVVLKATVDLETRQYTLILAQMSIKL